LESCHLPGKGKVKAAEGVIVTAASLLLPASLLPLVNLQLQVSRLLLADLRLRLLLTSLLVASLSAVAEKVCLIDARV